MSTLFTPTNGQRRLSMTEYLALCKAHLSRYWKHYAIPVVAVFLLQTVIRVDVNYTESLPDHVFVTIKGWKTGLKRGDYVTYHFPTESPVSPFRKGDHMVKIVGGIAGDVVEMDGDRNFTINGAGASASWAKTMGGFAVGKSKPFSRAGKPLDPGPIGTIPPGAVYVFAPHKDSLDSRYAIVGWITENDIIGRTFPVF